MKTFPVFLNVAGARIVIIGNGEQAAQKARLALKTEAKIVLVSDHPDAELIALNSAGRIEIQPMINRPSLWTEAKLCFVATGCKGADAAWYAIAKSVGVTVNVVDYPELCDAFTPSIVDRDPVVIAIGTEGTAPVLGRQIKTRIEEFLEPKLGEFAATAGRLRAATAQRVPAEKRRAFWQWVFGGAPRRLFASGQERDAVALVKAAIENGGPVTSQGENELTILQIGQSDPDLLSVRAVKRLQDADTLFVDHDVDAKILEWARRDAHRVVLEQNAEVGDPVGRVFSRVRSGEKVVWVVGSHSGDHDFERLNSPAPVEILNCATTSGYSGDTNDGGLEDQSFFRTASSQKS